MMLVVTPSNAKGNHFTFARDSARPYWVASCDELQPPMILIRDQILEARDLVHLGYHVHLEYKCCLDYPSTSTYSTFVASVSGTSNNLPRH